MEFSGSIILSRELVLIVFDFAQGLWDCGYFSSSNFNEHSNGCCPVRTFFQLLGARNYKSKSLQNVCLSLLSGRPYSHYEPMTIELCGEDPWTRRAEQFPF